MAKLAKLNKEELPRCRKCGSTNGYVRQDRMLICRKCGSKTELTELKTAEELVTEPNNQNDVRG